MLNRRFPERFCYIGDGLWQDENDVFYFTEELEEKFPVEKDDEKTRLRGIIAGLRKQIEDMRCCGNCANLNEDDECSKQKFFRPCAKRYCHENNMKWWTMCWKI